MKLCGIDVKLQYFASFELHCNNYFLEQYIEPLNDNILEANALKSNFQNRLKNDAIDYEFSPGLLMTTKIRLLSAKN